jgi:predicted RNA-binding Zn ribbon-like protein
MPVEPREDLAGAVWLREAIDACVRAAVSGESPAAEPLAVIDAGSSMP